MSHVIYDERLAATIDAVTRFADRGPTAQIRPVPLPQVGAVCVDRLGRLAAAVSSGGSRHFPAPARRPAASESGPLDRPGPASRSPPPGECEIRPEI